MSTSQKDRLVPLTDASFRTGEPYRRLWDKAVSGALGPVTREGSRIYVTARGVDAYLASAKERTAKREGAGAT